MAFVRGDFRVDEFRTGKNRCRTGTISAGPRSLIGRAAGSEWLSQKTRSPFACGDRDWRLSKPVRSLMLAAKLPVSGECRVKGRKIE